MSNFSSKVAIVTGASRGLGQALCKELIEKYEIIVVGIGRDQDTLDHMARQCGSKFIPFVCDVSSIHDVIKVFDFLRHKNMKIDYFFLNAGLAGEQALEENGFDINKHHELFKTNYFGVLNFVECWLKTLPTHQTHHIPHFIVTGSVNAFWAPRGGAAYAASKAAIAKAFEGFSLTFLGQARFSCIYCGPVQTKGLKGTVPLTWSPQRMAQYMVEFALKNKRGKYPSLFYMIVCRILAILPTHWVARIFKRNL